MLKQDLLAQDEPQSHRSSICWRGEPERTAVCPAFALIGLIVYGVVVGGIREDLGVWATVGRATAGRLAAVGLCPRLCNRLPRWGGVPAVANLIYVPLAFASGLFIPVSQLPVLRAQQVAPYLPTYHYGQLAWSAIGAPSEPVAVSLAWLTAYMVLFLALALRAYRREEEQKFG